MNKAHNPINWQNYPETKTPINADNLNKMDFAIGVIDDRVIQHESDIKQRIKTINGQTADDNGEVTIEYDVGSDRRYRHDGLTRLPKTIEVYENETYTNIPYVFLGENLWPAVEYVDGNSFDKNGVSFITDAHNIAVSGTATAGGSFVLKTDPNSSIYQEIDGMFDVGDTLSLYVFSNVSEYTSPFVKVGIYDEGKSRIAYKQINIGAGKNFGSANLTVPEGAKYVRYDIAYNSGNTYNSVVFPVLIKYGTPVINNSEFSNGVANFETDSETDILCTAPYESIVFHKLGLKDYIDNRSNSVDFDMSEVEKTMSFVTPEMFGAYGDSVHDDTIAVQECIDYAIANGRRVIGGGMYLTSEPIVINATILMVDIRSITYSGTDAAVIVTGETNTLRFSYINCANGAGIRLKSDKITGYNNIYVAYLVSKKNCIEYITSVNGIVGNTLTFEKLECTGGENCIYQSDQKIGINHNNNNFIGGKLSRGEWGVYGAKGNDTYITCQFEGPKNGICLTGNGICRVISPRYAELKRLALDFNVSERPLITGQGVMFAVNVSPDWLDDEAMRRIGFELSPSDDYLYPQSIDVSNAPLVFNNGGIIGKGYPDAVCIKAPLMNRKTRKLAQEFYVFGKHLIIKQPHISKTLTVTKNDIGYQDDYRITDSDVEFDIYERFIISESDCDYTLPPSYDWIGFKEFIVEQSENTNCVFRDWRGTVIFNGVDYGVGTYKVTASCSSPDGDTYYNENQIWTIRRINEGDVVATSSHTD